MKEMKYCKDRKIEVLATGYCLGLLYYILNLGTHPTAYIKIPKEYRDRINDIEVNGGITYYSEEGLYVSENEKIEGCFIGWDYAHYGDYTGFEEMLPLHLRTGGKKWKTKEIFKEVKEACYQLRK